MHQFEDFQNENDSIHSVFHSYLEPDITHYVAIRTDNILRLKENEIKLEYQQQSLVLYH